MYSDDELSNADVLGDFDDDLRTSVPDRLAVIRDHEKAHVDALTDTVQRPGGNAVAEAEYDFGYETRASSWRSARPSKIPASPPTRARHRPSRTTACSKPRRLSTTSRPATPAS